MTKALGSLAQDIYRPKKGEEDIISSASPFCPLVQELEYFLSVRRCKVPVLLFALNVTSSLISRASSAKDPEADRIIVSISMKKKCFLNPVSLLALEKSSTGFSIVLATEAVNHSAAQMMKETCSMRLPHVFLSH